ncbi:hypothetical protein LOD99_12375 [Oopsacas minuta]|uniref:Uncharacterized protein n=1 Tax=Oopsacas minuta TaxID=111878 RepID=A0AAV7JFD3_9METZ|nr:hypothetical protein LOD99_12375 [Oopsacas minuta]
MKYYFVECIGALERPNESYTKLLEKLTERVKLPLLAAVVDKELNKQIRDVTKTLFHQQVEQRLQSQNSLPSQKQKNHLKNIVLWFNAEQHPTCSAHWASNARLAARVRYLYQWWSCIRL